MTEVEFRVLGPVEAVRDGRLLALSRGTLLDLLAALLISSNQVVGVESLAETVWYGRSPVHPRATLQSAVARLRRTIGGDFIETFPSGYRFRAEADYLDLLRFERLRTMADAAETTEDAVAALAEAVELWRGPPLHNVDSPSLLNEAAPRLTQAYLDACEKWAGLCLEIGRHEDVAARLTAMVEAHPFRERLVEQLMLALYRGARQADAIASYETLRRALSDEMGVDPGPALRDLHLKILRADPALDAGSLPGSNGNVSPPRGDMFRPESTGLDGSSVAVPRQLPRDLPDFCGREAEIEQLTDLLTGTSPAPGETPVAVISGKPGIGKTALAIRAAHQVSATFPDGQLIANLHGGGPRSAPAESVLVSFLHALGVPGSAVPRLMEDRIAMFRSLAASRRLLVVLDNAASETQVRSLLPGSASCAVIITSRTRITGLAGANLINLDVLDDDHALDLLSTIIGCERVAAEQDDARLLIALCGGLPLALRIVGVRLAAKAHWPLAKLIGRLSDQRRRLNELTYGDLDVRATFALSYDALDEPAKAMLRRLSLLDAPDFPAWAGAALLDIGPVEAGDICERLVDAQLLDARLRDPGPRHPVSEIRYEFHDLVRAFAREQANATEPEDVRIAALDRAFGAWLALAEQAHRRVYGGDYTILHGDARRWVSGDVALRRAIRHDPVAWMEGERLAILAAVRQSAEASRPEVCWDLAWTATTLYEARGYYDDWRAVTEYALIAVRSAGSARGIAAMLTSLVSLRSHSGSVDPEMRGLAEQALRLFDQIGDRHGCALAGFFLGFVCAKSGQTEHAIRVYEQVRTDAHQAGDAFIEAGALRELADAHLGRGDYEAATACLTRSLRLHERTGSPRGKATALLTLGKLRLRQGDPQAARVIFQQVLDITHATNDIVGHGFVSIGLAEALAYAGLPDQAEERLQEALRLGRRIQNRTVERHALAGLDWLNGLAVLSECSQQAGGSPG
ncbi:MAG: tetratricopeptide repeat protein [Streptosporangiaceae bacterium]|nr:tetratricopeptide repeat protein [Streptosporangiaceae bacterium]